MILKTVMKMKKNKKGLRILVLLSPGVLKSILRMKGILSEMIQLKNKMKKSLKKALKTKRQWTKMQKPVPIHLTKTSAGSTAHLNFSKDERKTPTSPSITTLVESYKKMNKFSIFMVKGQISTFFLTMDLLYRIIDMIVMSFMSIRTWIR